MCCVYILLAMVARAIVMQKSIDSETVMSEAYDIRADQTGDQLLHKGILPKFKNLLLWSYKRSCGQASLNVTEADRRVKMRLKQNDVNLLVELLHEIRELLQEKRESWENKNINDYEKQLKIFYKSMIDQLQVLKEYVKQAGESWTVDSLTDAVEACLYEGWCGHGDMCKEYTNRFLKLKPIANQKLAKLESQINTMKKQNVKLQQQQQKSFKSNYGKTKTRPKSRSTTFSRTRKSKGIPVPFEGGPGVPPRNECILGTNLRRIFEFCDKFQVNKCFWGEKCFFYTGHLCSFCGDKNHGRLDCPKRNPNWG